MNEIQVLINSLVNAQGIEALKNQLVVALTRVYQNASPAGSTQFYARLNQSATNAPVITQQSNNTGITFTSAYNDAGDYLLNMSSSPDISKVNVQLTNGLSEYNVCAFYDGSGSISITVLSVSSVSNENNGLKDASLIVTIFP